MITDWHRTTWSPLKMYFSSPIYASAYMIHLFPSSCDCTCDCIVISYVWTRTSTIEKEGFFVNGQTNKTVYPDRLRNTAPAYVSFCLCLSQSTMWINVLVLMLVLMLMLILASYMYTSLYWVIPTTLLSNFSSATCPLHPMHGKHLRICFNFFIFLSPDYNDGPAIVAVVSSTKAYERCWCWHTKGRCTLKALLPSWNELSTNQIQCTALG